MIVLIRIQDAFIPFPLQVIFVVSVCFYMDMNCFRLVRVVASLLRVGSVTADIIGWVVADGFGWFVVLVVTYYQHKGFSCSGKFKIRWKWSCLEVGCRDTLLFCRHVFTFSWQHELLSVLLTFCFNPNINCKTENWYCCPFHLPRFFLLTEAMLLIKYRKNSCEGVLS